MYPQIDLDWWFLNLFWDAPCVDGWRWLRKQVKTHPTAETIYDLLDKIMENPDTAAYKWLTQGMSIMDDKYVLDIWTYLASTHFSNNAIRSVGKTVLLDNTILSLPTIQKIITDIICACDTDISIKFYASQVYEDTLLYLMGFEWDSKTLPQYVELLYTMWHMWHTLPEDLDPDEVPSYTKYDTNKYIFLDHWLGFYLVCLGRVLEYEPDYKSNEVFKNLVLDVLLFMGDYDPRSALRSIIRVSSSLKVLHFWMHSWLAFKDTVPIRYAFNTVWVGKGHWETIFNRYLYSTNASIRIKDSDEWMQELPKQAANIIQQDFPALAWKLELKK